MHLLKLNRSAWMMLVLIGVLSGATAVLAEEKPAESQPAETQPDQDEAPASQPQEDDSDDAQADAAEDDSDDDSDTAPNRAVLLDPSHESWSRQAPDVYKVTFVTTKGDVVIQVTREWAPLGADRFYNLVDNGFYDGCQFYRVIEGFMAQFGANGDPEVSDAWRDQRLMDDPNLISNARGRITFAMSGPNSRTTQLFINYGDNNFLDNQGFSPFGEIIEGMDIVDKFHADYGEGAPRGRGPSQGRIRSEGNAYLNAEFPNLDSIVTARVVE
jgi:peptidyl-prolyl cis-trans isomerase A (cyclophilin A)